MRISTALGAAAVYDNMQVSASTEDDVRPITLISLMLLLSSAANAKGFTVDAKTRAMTADMQHLQRAAKIEWYAANCPINISAELIEESRRTIAGATNPKALELAREMYATGTAKVRARDEGHDPCKFIEEHLTG